jgi:tetratricopeptide (TPR) repeat protein
VRWRSLLVAAGIAATALVSACATESHNRFIRRSGSGPIEVEQDPRSAPRTSAPSAQVGVQQPGIRPAAATTVSTAEGTHAELRDALASLKRRPSASAHLGVAHAYAHARVDDQALDHFDQALELDSRLAAAYDGRARLWRDWHFLSPALADATRAVYFAPRSPEARNTMGTVLAALKDRTAAAAAFRCAMALDPDALYAGVNLSRLGDVSGVAPSGCVALSQAGRHGAPKRGEAGVPVE